MYEARPSPSSSPSSPPPSPLAMMCGQCGVPDLNRDPVRSVFRTGPQPRSAEFPDLPINLCKRIKPL